MNLCMMALCVALSGAPQQPRDRWVAEDKWRHFFSAFVATTLAAGTARLAGVDAERSAYFGAGVGAGVGVWKELRDVRTPGSTASVRDIVWDAAGVGAGTLVALQAR